MRERPADTHNALAVAVFGLGLVTACIGVAWLLWAFVTDAILAFLFASMLTPRFQRLTRRLGERRWIAAGLVTAALVVIIAVPATFIITSLSVEAAGAYRETRDSVTMERLTEFLFGDNPFATQVRRGARVVGVDYTPESVKTLITNVLGSVASFLYAQINALLSNLVSFLYHFAIMTVLVFYLLLDGERLQKFLFRLSPLPDVEEELLSKKFKDVGRAIVFGNGLGSVIQGVLGGVAMAIAGLPSPVLWGTVMTIFAFLPLVGISVVAVPAAAYLALNGHVGAAIGFIIFCTVMGLVVENVVKTRLIGSHMQMHDLLIFLSILGGLGAFGVLGILYGPLLLVYFLTMTDLYEQHYRARILAWLTPLRARVEDD